MVLTGTRDVTPLLTHAPVLDNLGADPWTLDGAEILQVAFEIDDRDREGLLPRALHPTIPPAAIFTVAHYPTSPVGAFLLAQVRVSCRAAALPRGFLLRAYTDSQPAADALARGWGYNCEVGDLQLRRYHDRITGSVSDGAHEFLRISLIDPEPISGGDIQYVANMNLASLGEEPLLIQVDPEFTFHRAERGRPEIAAFDRVAWQAEGVDPVYPMVASFTRCDTTLPQIRYVLDPNKMAIEGTRKIR